MQNNAKRK